MFKFNLLLTFILATFNLSLFAQSKFELPSLDYPYNALERAIDEQTMMIHHTKHHQGYVNNLNKAIEGTDAANISIEEILKNVSKYSDAVRNNAGGHYNHSLFWKILTPQTNTQPSKRFLDAINYQFGGMDSLKIKLTNAASSRFGSGWAWLSIDKNNKLFISSTPNQDNPLMDVVEKQGVPILGIDVWEHAYYLRYQNKRNDYLAAIWSVINWEEVSKRYEAIVPKGKFDDWPEIKSFHKVMAQTFHPSEEGNLEPIKSRIGEMVEKANILAKSNIPKEFKNKKVIQAVNQLASDSKKLQKTIQSGASDEKIKKDLSSLHDVFHQIIGLCSNEEHH
jgi:superoxide dismutase